MPNKERQGKWQPFDALEGYKSSLRKVEYEKGKIEKPVLMPDKIEEMNFKLTDAVENHKEIVVCYYKSGYIYEIDGFITKVDPINKEIFIGANKVKFTNILEIKDKL